MVPRPGYTLADSARAQSSWPQGQVDIGSPAGVAPRFAQAGLQYMEPSRITEPAWQRHWGCEQFIAFLLEINEPSAEPLG